MLRGENFFFQFSCDSEQFHEGGSFGFLVIKVCNHGEHYETPCITWTEMQDERYNCRYIFSKAVHGST